MKRIFRGLDYQGRNDDGSDANGLDVSIGILNGLLLAILLVCVIGLAALFFWGLA